jgi:hypothetical protein
VLITPGDGGKGRFIIALEVRYSAECQTKKTSHAAKIVVQGNGKKAWFLMDAIGKPVDAVLLAQNLSAMWSVLHPDSALHRHLVSKLGPDYASFSKCALMAFRKDASRGGFPEPYASCLSKVFLHSYT